MRSVPPPAAQGTITVISLSGYSAAAGARGDRSIPAAKKALIRSRKERRVLRTFGLLFIGHLLYRSFVRV
jgi:hypothetical protein